MSLETISQATSDALRDKSKLFKGIKYPLAMPGLLKFLSEFFDDKVDFIDLVSIFGTDGYVAIEAYSDRQVHSRHHIDVPAGRLAMVRAGVGDIPRLLTEDEGVGLIADIKSMFLHIPEDRLVRNN